MPLTKYEQETIITFNRAEKTAEVFTYDKKWQRHIEERLGIQPHLVNDRGGKQYTVPKRSVTKPRKSPPPLRHLTPQ